MGIGIDLIRIMLGHATLKSLKHYVAIHDITMIDVMRNIVEEDNQRISLIQNPRKAVDDPASREDESLLPLPNGYCSKKISTGLCEHANACYTCRMFQPSKNHMYIYEAQLRQADANIAIAELHGLTRVKEINTDLKNQLLSIIERVHNGAR